MLTMTCACSSKSDNNKAANGDATEQTVGNDGNATEVELTGHVTALSQHIKYIDSQKISAAYAPAREVAKADSAAQVKLASYQNQLGADLQKKQKAIEDKQARNGYLTQESFNADVAAFQKAQQDAENKFVQRQRELMVEVANKQEVVLDSIHSVILYLSETQKLDAVLEKSVGLYFNPALDMTDEVINELNRRLSK